MRTPVVDRERLSAVRLVLEFTQAKPAAKSSDIASSRSMVRGVSKAR